jgi:hypothetical protein
MFTDCIELQENTITVANKNMKTHTNRSTNVNESVSITNNGKSLECIGD